jgi:uncharacterized protein YndB with AHSA1/START domain
MTEAKPETGQKGRSINVEIELAADRETVWRALTDPRELERWFPLKASGNPSEEGGSLALSWGTGQEWVTRVAVLEPPAHLGFEDPVDPANPGAVSRIDFHVEARGGRTVVRLVHSGFGEGAEWDEQFTATQNGWRYFLMNLRHYLERHGGVPRTMVWERRKMSATRARVWEALFKTPLLEGIVNPMLEETSPERHAWGRLPALNDGLFFVEFECGPTQADWHLGVWISTYGVPATETVALQASLTSALDRRLTPLMESYS